MDRLVTIFNSLLFELWLTPTHFIYSVIQNFLPPIQKDTSTRPVFLIRGYGQNKAALCATETFLARRSRTHVYYFDSSILLSLEEQGKQLAKQVKEVCEVTGHSKVDIIAHSMGGLIARAAIQFCDLEDNVNCCVTIGTPHNGTYMAYLGIGLTARQMRPKSDFILKLNNSPLHDNKVRYLGVWSNLDLIIIPNKNAQLKNIENVLSEHRGHLSMIWAEEVAALVIDFLVEENSDVNKIKRKLNPFKKEDPTL